MLYKLLLIFLTSFFTTILITPWLIPKLKRARIVGKDLNKPNTPETPEMGGFSIIFGLSFGILLAIGLATFFHIFDKNFQLAYILAAFLTILMMAFIGIFDDLFAMHQAVKAILPLFASLPLIAVRAGTTAMTLPLLGQVDFGIFYILILVPIAIAGASNVTNMLAGFNGLEAGMGFIACSSLAFVAWRINSLEALIILLSMSGALLAFLLFNWYPAKVLIGDIGTLTIGAVIASSVIIGNFESFGLILIIPYGIDFVIKALNGFPSKNWWGIYKKGKLYSPKKPVGFCQLIMKLTGGISEEHLVLILIGIEAVFGLIVILMVL
jgi:UDP-N-acetylglucosamine--dolichyl-phosphate N-acetylglucosaminephosphotransferase